MSNTIVELKNATNSFAGKTVLKNINLEISKGEVVGIIGPSGAGKSTLLRCLTLLETLDRGSLRYGQHQVATDDGKRAVYANKNVQQQARSLFGMVFQQYNLFPHFTVMQNICDAPISVQKRDKAEVESRAKELISQLNLNGLENKVPCQLSGGQQQRVAIARALALNPSVLYFDEPTSALDPELTKEFENVILNLRKSDIAMVLVTHAMSFVKNVTDKIAFVLDGEIVEFGSTEQVISSPKHERTRKFLLSPEK